MKPAPLSLALTCTLPLLTALSYSANAQSGSIQLTPEAEAAYTESLLPSNALAQNDATADTTANSQSDQNASTPDSASSSQSEPDPSQETETDHPNVTLADGRSITYQVAADSITLHSSDGNNELAQIHYTHYIAHNPETNQAYPAAERPILFNFNGGPGSASIWLHLGAFSPRVIQFDHQALDTPRIPAQLIDNPDTLLANADLVFVDPVGTGFSRAEKPEANKNYWSPESDVQSCTDFIHRYLTQHQRWASPLYLAGESYGALRVSAMASALQERGIAPEGVALISGLLDFATLVDPLYQILSYTPTYATTAHYHQHQIAQQSPRYSSLENPQIRLNHQTPADQELSDQDLIELHNQTAQAAAQQLIPHILLTQTDVRPEQSRQISETLSQHIGIASETLLANHNRLAPSIYRNQLLSGLNLGRFDSRIINADASPNFDFSRTDPSYLQIAPVFRNAANQYFRDQLGIEQTINYNVLGHVRWSWSSSANSYYSTTETLDQALLTDPDLDIFVALGFFDLATPPEAIRYSLRQLQHGQDRIHQHWYQGGHMMYLIEAERQQLNQDLNSWIQRNQD